MNEISFAEQLRGFSTPVRRSRAKDFVLDLAYKIAGLPVAVRGVITRDQSPEAVIRRAYARRYWRPQTALEIIRLLVAILIWPIVLIGVESVFLFRNGAAARRQSGRPFVRQMFDQLKFNSGAMITGFRIPLWD